MQLAANQLSAFKWESVMQQDSQWRLVITLSVVVM